MFNFTSNTYKMKREILTFSNKISKKLSKPERKFTADMTYGMLASGNNHPVSIFSKLHSSKEKAYASTNDVTFSAMERGAAFLAKQPLLWIAVTMITKCFHCIQKKHLSYSRLRNNRASYDACNK